MAWDLTATSGDVRRMNEMTDDKSDGALDGAAPLTVSEALACAKGALEAMTLVVEGEVSQFKDSPAYKAVYFPLADASGVMDCMMWRNRYLASGIELQPGLKVRLTGRFSVYPAKGRMQFEIFKLEPAGVGDLRERVARLARKLEAEGLMAPERKLPIPTFCQRVVVITSPHGKVKDDVARTLRQRNRLVELQYCAVPVEGATAAQGMIEALHVAEAAAPDAILLVRGGGSYEDLMPFNDEALARAIAACRVPVITGIGHEPDTTICDMVADRRASTPTFAAASVAPTTDELLGELNGEALRMAEALNRKLMVQEHELDILAGRPAISDPVHTLLDERWQRLDFAHDRLTSALPGMVETRGIALNAYAARMKAAGTHTIGPLKDQCDACARHLKTLAQGILAGPSRQVAVSAGRLEALSPLAVIARGYAMVLDDNGAIVSHIGSLRVGDPITARIADGYIDATVDRLRPLE